MNRVKKISKLYGESGSSKSRNHSTLVRQVHKAAVSVKVKKEELENLNYRQLQTLARTADIKGRSHMRKTELVRALTSYAK